MRVFPGDTRFYASADFEARDIAYVATSLATVTRLLSPIPIAPGKAINSAFSNFTASPPSTEGGGGLAVEIATMARTHLKPRLIFDRCVDFLIQRRVQVPRAGTLLELIRSGMQARKTELVALMDAHLTDEARGLLDDLFTAPDDRTAIG